MKKQLPGWAVLLIITLVAGLALGGTNALTKDPIAQQALIKAENARKAALPDADSFEELTLSEGAAVDWVYAGLKDGSPVGYVAQKTVNGFGGKVEVIAGVDTKAAPDTFSIGGITVGGSDFSETAGLGARAKEPAFTDQFTGKIAPISYIKAGGEAAESTVDALTSATITTTAVVNGVNDIVKYVKADVMGIAGVEMPAKPADGVFSASEKGFRGPVYVEAAFDSAGKVTYIKVGDENFAEDIGVGVIEPDFMIQFIGKQMPLEVSDIDVIAGATISSTAVVKALNTAYAVAGGAEIVVPETPTMPEKPAEGVYSASADGFRGPVYVEAAFDADAKVTYISVGDDSFAEDIGVGVIEPDFMIQFIGKQAPLEVSDIDVIAGATISSTAVVNALNKAYNASQGIVEEVVEIVMPEKPAEGVFSAAEKGFAGPVYTEAAFDADGKITYISVGDDQFAETEGFGAKALVAENLYPFIGAQMPLNVEDVDALSGATFTKTAIVNSLNKAYAASKGEVAEEPVVEETPAETKAVSGTVTASAQGFGGPVAVEAAFDDEGKITYIKIGDDSFAETPGLGARALEDEFQAQFIGKQMPLTLNDIDAIAGATVTSTAVVNALNDAYASVGAAKPVEEPADEPAIEAAAEPTEEQELPVAELLLAKNYGASAETVLDSKDIQVRVTKANGVIAGLIVLEKPEGSEESAYTVSSLDEEMKNLFLGKTLPLDVNGQSGMEAAAIANAINIACGFEAQTIAAEEKPADAASTLTLRVTVETDNDTLTGLTVLEKAPDSEEFVPCGQEEALKEKFIGLALPLETKQSSLLESVAAIAINKAYYDAVHEADASAASAEPEDSGSDEPCYLGEAIIFFTSIRAKVAITPAITVEAVSFEEKQVGAEAYQPSERSDRLEALFVGESLPLDVAAYDDPYETAAAIAINEAFEQMPDLDEPYTIVFSGFSVGESISFFTVYRAAAAFEGSTLTTFGVYKTPIGDEGSKQSVYSEALAELLCGKEMPLSVGEYMVPDLPEYEVIAIEIALNQAYVNFLAGLQ